MFIKKISKLTLAFVAVATLSLVTVVGYNVAFATISSGSVSAPTTSDQYAGADDVDIDVSFETDTAILAQTITVTFPSGYSIQSGTIGTASSAICNSGCAINGYISVNGVNKLVDNVIGSGNTITVSLNNATDLSVGTVAFRLKLGIDNPTASGLTDDFTITTNGAGETAQTDVTGIIILGTNNVSDVLFTQQPVGGNSGAVLSTQPIVTVFDEFGNIAEGYNGDVSVSLFTGAGSLGGTTTVSAVNGVATFTNLTYAAGSSDHESFSLEASANSEEDLSSLSSVNVVANHIVLYTAPASVVSGVSMTQPVVRFVNAGGIVDTDVSDSVAITENGSGSITSGTTTVAASSGVVTYSGLIYTASADNESVTFTFTDAAGGTFNFSGSPVSSGALTASILGTQFVFTTQPSGSVSGIALSGQPVVASRNTAGQTDTDFTGLITLSLDSGAGSLSGTLALSATAGVATFTNVAYTATADGQSFSLDADGDHSGTSNSTASDVVATKIIVHTQPSGSGAVDGNTVSGVFFSTPPVIWFVDANNTLDTDVTGDLVAVVKLSGSGSFACVGACAGPVTGIGTTTAGVATFGNLRYSNNAADGESFVLRFTDSGAGALDLSGSPVDSNSLKSDVVATKLVFTTQPTGSVSGEALTGQPVVTAKNAADLMDDDYVTDVALTINTGAGSLSGTTTKTPVAGVATFTDVAYAATSDHQTVSLDADSGSLPTIESDDFDSDVVATGFNFYGDDSVMVAGTGEAFTIEATDTDGTIDTDYDPTGKTFSISVIDGVTLENIALHESPNGDAVTHDNSATVIGSFSDGVGEMNINWFNSEYLEAISVTDGSFTGDSDEVFVRHDDIALFTIVPTTLSATLGTPLTFTLTAVDAYGNVINDSQGATAYESVGGAGVVAISTDATSATIAQHNYSFVTGDNGTKTFTNGVTFNTAESVVLTASNVQASGASDTIVVSGSSGALAVTGIDTVQSVGIANDTFADGFEWAMHVTAPIDEDAFGLKFGDFISGGNTIGAADNVRYCSVQSTDDTDCSDEGDWVVISAADTYGDNLILDTDLAPTTPGRQVTVRIQVKIPVSTPGGSYSTSYGARSETLVP